MLSNVSFFSKNSKKRWAAKRKAEKTGLNLKKKRPKVSSRSFFNGA